MWFPHSKKLEHVEVEYFPRENDDGAFDLLDKAIKIHDPRSFNGDLLKFPLLDSEKLFGYLTDVHMYGPAMDDVEGDIITLSVTKGNLPPFCLKFPKSYVKQSQRPTMSQKIINYSKRFAHQMFLLLQRGT